MTKQSGPKATTLEPPQPEARTDGTAKGAQSRGCKSFVRCRSASLHSPRQGAMADLIVLCVYVLAFMVRRASNNLDRAEKPSQEQAAAARPKKV